MNAVLGPVRDLVDRRLWPVAVALVAAALAAPILLADRGDVPPPASAANPVQEDGLAAATIVSVAGPDGVTRRRVLGAAKDPFTPSGDQPKPRRAPSSRVSSASSGTSASSSAATPPSSFQGGGSTGGASAPAPLPPLAGAPTPSFPNPPVTAPARPRSRKPELFSLRVRFEGAGRTLKRLDPLPDGENAAIIYLGVLKDRKTAVFLLDAAVEAQGDGTCHPSPRDCQRLYLREGETEFFDVGGPNGAQYQIDLLDIRAKRAGNRASVSAAGRRALRSRMSRVGRLRYDARKGTLRHLTMRGWRAQVGRSR